jgi:hypothetical protein
MAVRKDGYVVKKLDRDVAELGDVVGMLKELNSTGMYNGMHGTYELCDGREIKFYPNQPVTSLKTLKKQTAKAPEEALKEAGIDQIE